MRIVFDIKLSITKFGSIGYIHVCMYSINTMHMHTHNDIHVVDLLNLQRCSARTELCWSMRGIESSFVTLTRCHPLQILLLVNFCNNPGTFNSEYS